MGIRDRFRRQVGAWVVDSFFEGTSRLGKFVPIAHPRLHNVEVIRDVPYRESGRREHLLDVYKPRGATGPMPVVLYLHGGGFRILSKESHWLFGLLFARRGYLVANINYRLAPEHPFPAAHEDAFAAYEWVLKNAGELGGDIGQIVLAGESAGGNLATSLAVATSYRRPEAWAAQVFDLGVSPKAIISGCGLLQVSEPGRFGKKWRIPSVLQDRIDEVTEAYLPEVSGPACSMADPLCILEQAGRPDRPLPPIFAFCGTWDFLIDDTRRLADAVERLGGTCDARYFPRGLHAFHAFVFDPNARRAWRDTFDFLDRHLPMPPTPATRLFSRTRNQK